MAEWERESGRERRRRGTRTRARMSMSMSIKDWGGGSLGGPSGEKTGDGMRAAAVGLQRLKYSTYEVL